MIVKKYLSRPRQAFVVLAAISIGLFSSGCGSEDQSATKIEPAGSCFAVNSSLATSPITNPYLYEVTKGGRTSYLLGTIHLGVSLQELPAYVTTLIDRADTVIAEIVLPQQRAMLLLQENSIEKAAIEQSLQYRQTSPFSLVEQAKLRCHGIPAAVVEAMGDDDCRKVIFAPLLFPRLSFLDVEISLRAYRNGTPQVAVDTEVILADAKRLHPTQDDQYSCSIKRDLLWQDPTVFRKMSVDLTVDYREGTKEFDGDAQVDYRNRAWMPSVIQQMSSRSAFMAVGVAHLYGASGVIRLLESHGFRVRRVQ